jgi:hypothetical protein
MKKTNRYNLELNTIKNTQQMFWKKNQKILMSFYIWTKVLL